MEEYGGRISDSLRMLSTNRTLGQVHEHDVSDGWQLQVREFPMLGTSTLPLQQHRKRAPWCRVQWMERCRLMLGTDRVDRIKSDTSQRALLA